MKKIKNLFIIIICIAMLFSFFTTPQTSVFVSADTLSGVYIEGSSADAASYQGYTRPTDAIRWWNNPRDGKNYLFVPSSADMSALKIFFTADNTVTVNGKTLVSGTVTDAFSGGGEFTFMCGSASYKVVVRQTSDIPTMFITTETETLNYIHANKAYREAAKMLLVGADGKTVEYNGDLDHIKGRGNFSWDLEKKPYNIKLNEKTSLLGMGKSKKWCLVANYIDQSQVRHKTSYQMADEIGLSFSAKVQHIDLYINNYYLGLYQLTEKVEIGDPLVNISDLEDATQKVNSAPLDSYTRGGPNYFSANTYKYYNIPINPADITGGYLLEIEIPSRYPEELCGFVTKKGQAVVIKYPEHASKEQVEYIRNFYQDMEDAVYSTTGYNDKGKHYSEYVNEETFEKMYALAEYLMNHDTCMTSFYMHKDSDQNGGEKIACGPIWDMEGAFSNGSDSWPSAIGYLRLDDPEIFWIANGLIYNENFSIFLKNPPHLLAAFYKHADFRQRAIRQYYTNVLPLHDKLFNPDSTVETKNLQYYRYFEPQIQNSFDLNRIKWDMMYKPNLYGLPLSISMKADLDIIKSFAERRAVFLSKNWNTSLDNLTFCNVSPKEFTGSEIKPDVEIRDKGVLLKKDTDYSLTYNNNTDIGTAEIIIKGEWFYKGTKTVTFEIMESIPTTTIPTTTDTITIIIISSTSPISTTSTTSIAIIKGDINGDGKVNGMDLFIMKQHILAVPGKKIKSDLNAFFAADMNNDGVINGMDLLLLKKKILT